MGIFAVCHCQCHDAQRQRPRAGQTGACSTPCWLQPSTSSWGSPSTPSASFVAWIRRCYRILSSAFLFTIVLDIGVLQSSISSAYYWCLTVRRAIQESRTQTGPGLFGTVIDSALCRERSSSTDLRQVSQTVLHLLFRVFIVHQTHLGQIGIVGRQIEVTMPREIEDDRLALAASPYI